ncbi:hypothetical protein [Natrinema thermotolerans]|uniref:hypothetical protein n=1 Tax=Natrinema thermotolerans TaxID=121872 RepID=UPI000679D8BC|nr:hypothetical protein [Natrinema thermotolerans]QCC57219.1 hypothetical protein DVR14_00670 [Natrinema thermotolerans]
MSDDLPDPERTVIVEKAHLLHEQLEYSRENAEDPDNEIDAAYQERRVDVTESYIEAIEGDGLSEADVRDDLDAARDVLSDTEEETPEVGRRVAEADTAKQILGRYFGEDDNTLEVGEAMNVMGYEDGSVAFHGPGGKAIVEFSDEINARAAADCILDGVGAEDDAAMVGQR